jgi:hypoxanthine phosphoribosyltransferase
MFQGALLPGMERPGYVLHDDIEKVLIDEQQITGALDILGREIVAGFDGQDFTAVAVLKGAAVFVSDLIRRIPVPLELAFLMASSYREGTTAGKLDLDFFPNDAEIEGRRMLLVDDILDTGKTMYTLKRALLERGAPACPGTPRS